MATLGNPADSGRPDLEPSGRDSGALGPSDSSDSGSDTLGSPAARDDGAASDRAGTGERGSAAGREQPDGADILPDRVFDAEREPDDAEDPDLGFVDDLEREAAAPLEEDADAEDDDAATGAVGKAME
jgi:hypothetical protein